MNTIQPKWPFVDSANLEALCRVLGDTEKGLTGTEIGRLLADCNITDTDPLITKYKRLFNALGHSQNANNNSTFIFKFVSASMQPARYFAKQDEFNYRLNELNKRLSLLGFKLTDQAKFQSVNKATTLSEAEQRAGHFKFKLQLRNAHKEIIKFCETEINQENYFHSVFEGVKGLGDRLRRMSNVHADGTALVETAFSTVTPLIRINLLQNDTHKSEHLGFANIIKGLFSHIRNPTAHEPKIRFPIPEDEALDILTIVSFVHKKLDKAL